ncbi:hypothetical protein CERSUDRAFT_92780 [Gelatoporia subvermispora B]|uniref:Uncharacterized protein n=1 Tax=Ceriporiopsis subvermispora (strain B) TaxID=914234 RepID=M2RJU8_CERS8|nr:hypothetical protein CERSUDRAFT_92780 [Gelatoporia subvermispora B]
MSYRSDYSPSPRRHYRRRHSVGALVDGAVDSLRGGWNGSMTGAAYGGLGVCSTPGGPYGSMPYGQYGNTVISAPAVVAQPLAANTVGYSNSSMVVTPQTTTTALPTQVGVAPQMVSTGASLAQPGISAVAPQVAGTYPMGYSTGYYGPGCGSSYGYGYGGVGAYGTRGFSAVNGMPVPQGSTVIVQREPSHRHRHHHQDYAYDY